MKTLKKVYDWFNLVTPYLLGTIILLIFMLGGIGLVIQLFTWILKLLGVA